MTHLLSISIGPVQEFIAAGRRTNDLYSGSNLISEIARAAAESVSKSKAGELIFPANVDASAANKILAVVTDPEKVASAAKADANRYLRDEWRKAYERLQSLQKYVDSGIAEQQVNTFLEFYAAWWPWDGSDSSFKDARQNVERLLAGRKALREFKQPQKRNLFKSPLDPSRDTVMVDIESCDKPPLRLKGSEWLDAVSVLKRVRGFYGEKEQAREANTVPSTADIAARTYLTGQDELRRLLEREAIPFGAVFANLREDLVNEDALTAVAAARIASDMKGKPDPSPYLAVLAADGDGVGDIISGMESKIDCQKYSRKLAAFAEKAKGAVKENHGHPVYSGGDDVLALIPVHNALACAASLAQSFNSDVGGKLSVGIAIVHYHEPLYISLGQARDAEKLAKNKCAAAKADRGYRLALTYHTRGGQPRSAVWKWQDGFGYAAWRRWVEAFQGGLSRGFPYELEGLAREFDGANLDNEALYQEVCRIWCRKQGADTVEAGGRKTPAHWAAEEFHFALNSAGCAGLASLAKSLVLFRELADYPLRWEASR